MENQIAKLLRLHGHRVTSLDARRAGVPERVLFDAARAGLARLERTHVLGPADDRGYGGSHVSVYLIFG